MGTWSMRRLESIQPDYERNIQDTNKKKRGVKKWTEMCIIKQIILVRYRMTNKGSCYKSVIANALIQKINLCEGDKCASDIVTRSLYIYHDSPTLSYCVSAIFTLSYYSLKYARLFRTLYCCAVHDTAAQYMHVTLSIVNY